MEGMEMRRSEIECNNYRVRLTGYTDKRQGDMPCR
jgi:hypothetical protein